MQVLSCLVTILLCTPHTHVSLFSHLFVTVPFAILSGWTEETVVTEWLSCWCYQLQHINDVLNRQQNRPRNPTTTVPKKETILVLLYLGVQSKIVTKMKIILFFNTWTVHIATFPEISHLSPTQHDNSPLGRSSRKRTSCKSLEIQAWSTTKPTIYSERTFVWIAVFSCSYASGN